MKGEVHYGSTETFSFAEAVEFLKRKTPLSAELYEALGDACRAKAFSVAGYTSLELLQKFLEALTKAVEKGMTKEAFQEEMNRFLEDQGYKGLNPWRADVIFRTNLQTAYNAGHYKAMTDDTVKKLRPYWQYKTAADGHVRESHAVMEGRVYRAEDPIWDVWYPPNGFRCRCMVVSLSPAQVEARGLRVEREPPVELDLETGELKTLFPDKGFSCNPAKTAWRADLSGMSGPLKELYQERKPESLKSKPEA